MSALTEKAQTEDFDADESEAELPDLSTLTGLVDPKKQTGNMDIIRESDLQVARNLRRLEIHRFEIANALENLSDEDIGNFIAVEDEIEISETDEKYANHIDRINKNKAARQKQRIDPDTLIDQRLEKILSVLKRATGNLTEGLDLKSWDYMRHNFCLSWHQWRYDREMESRLFHPLAKYRTMRRSRTLREREEVAPCAPVRLVNWSLDCIAAYQEGGSFRQFMFIDPNAGHGRTLLLASHRDFRAIYGMETRGALTEDATLNIAQYPRTYMTQRKIELITKDSRLIDWPDHPLVIHLFNPESANSLSQLLENIGMSFANSPRQIYVVIIGNGHKQVMNNFSYLHPFTPPSSNLELLTLMSPYDIDFYHSAPNA